MIRRNCRSLLLFGSAAAALLVALPALADDIEPEPYVEEEAVDPEMEAEVEEAEVVEDSTVAEQHGSRSDRILDAIILRPFGFIWTTVGGALFIPAAVMASPSGTDGIQAAWDHFVAPPFETTFKRPLGAY